MAELLRIPLNVKPLMMPFVLNPANGVNRTMVTAGSTIKLKGAQTFTFKKKESYDGAVLGNISICPKSIEKAIKNDISYTLIYDYNDKDSTFAKNKHAELKDVFDGIPSISIREYSLNARLNQGMDLLRFLWDGFNDGDKAASGDGVAFKTQATALWMTFKDLVGLGDNKSIVNIAIDNIKDKYQSKYFKKVNNKTIVSVCSIPWVLYYKMITTMTLNYYVLPFNGSFSLQSDGQDGWNAAGITGAGFAGNSIIGQAANYFLKNVKLDFTPTWDGSSAKGTDVEVSVDLFNDDVNSAVANFIMVQTLLAGNKNLQYNVFQHSPHVYDVRIDGMNRLFMCSANVRCEYKGVTRKPSMKFFEILDAHMNAATYKSDKLNGKMLSQNDMIRIPDIYSLTITFHSMLPNDFNNFIFSYVMNDKFNFASDELIEKSDVLDIMQKSAKDVEKLYELNYNVYHAELEDEFREQLLAEKQAEQRQALANGTSPSRSKKAATAAR